MSQTIRVVPQTPAQSAAIDAFERGKNLFLYGSAKTGKTFLAMYLAINEALQTNKKIHIIRSAVPSRDVGFLPGSLEEKVAVYEAPYKAICNTLMESDHGYNNLKKNDILVFDTTSFQRGVTYDDVIVVADEIQNYSFHEIDTLMTRLGSNVRVFLCGDFRQCDLERKHESGFMQAYDVIKSMRSFSCIRFFPSDIMCSDIAKEWLMLQESSSSNDGFFNDFSPRHHDFPAFLRTGTDNV